MLDLNSVPLMVFFSVICDAACQSRLFEEIEQLDSITYITEDIHSFKMIPH